MPEYEVEVTFRFAAEDHSGMLVRERRDDPLVEPICAPTRHQFAAAGAREHRPAYDRYPSGPARGRTLAGRTSSRGAARKRRKPAYAGPVAMFSHPRHLAPSAEAHCSATRADADSDVPPLPAEPAAQKCVSPFAADGQDKDSRRW